MTEILEDCFFFYNHKGEYLYGCSYFPSSDQSEIGIVIVPPVGHERLRCYRECVNLARDLAKVGYPTLRFDYRGEGESFGRFEDSNVDTRLEDIKNAIIELQNNSKIKKVFLLGFRAGALLSLIVATKLNVGKLILCEPVLDTKAYIKDLIRANIVMQRDYFGKVIKKDDEIRRDLEAGKPVSVYGFHISHNFFAQLEQIDISSYAERYDGEVLVVYFARREIQPKPSYLELQKLLNMNGSCKCSCLVNHFAWITKKVWMPSFEGLSQKVVAWLDAQE